MLGGACCVHAVARSHAAIDAQGTTAEDEDLEHPTCNRDVLKEMNKLVLVSQLEVEGECGNDSEDTQYPSDQASFVADDEQGSKAQFDDQCHYVTEVGEGKAARGNVSDSARGGSSFAYAAEDKEKTDKEATKEGNDVLGGGFHQCVLN